MKIILKELRETKINLFIIKKKPLIVNDENLDKSLDETQQLIAINAASIKTAGKRLK